MALTVSVDRCTETLPVLADLGGRVPESETLEEGCRKARPWRKGAGKRDLGGRMPESEALE